MSERRIDTPPAARRRLQEGWEICATPPAACADPQALAAFPATWHPAVAPGTVAMALRSTGAWSLDGPRRRFDSEDWWYRTRFDLDPGVSPDQVRLGLDGLATVCEAWLNGRLILRSENMFLAHVLQDLPVRAGANELCLVFRSLDHWLQRKRPRPRWRTPMVENQQLRWARTTVLGRTPGWSPPVAAVGPWRPVWLEVSSECTLAVEGIHTSLKRGVGRISLSADLRGRLPSDLRLVASAGGNRLSSAPATADGGKVRVELEIPEPALWWPHTHGEQARYALHAELRFADGSTQVMPLGSTGFREVLLDADNGDFAVRVNGERVFCRGACWTPLDIVSLQADEPALRAALMQARDAGMNMLRISGAFVYEHEEFHALCDELGILVWQDFMFANMDYPAEDAAFAESVQREVLQQLKQWGKHPSVAVICGNSEVSQQAAMWGSPRDLWQPSLFHREIAGLVARHCPQTPYWPSSAWGGHFPHQVDSGTTSYYGVGAYLRDTDDLRRSGLRFATECLGFANVPDDALLATLPGPSPARVHHAIWKERAPRDLGAGWDFDDVRDHYLREVYGLDPLALRYSDHARYLALSRRIPGELMRAAFTEWRTRGSTCRGALVWFLRDLWPGAGWGLIDSAGTPKAALHQIRDVLQPRWLGITDEGLNGPRVHVGNETAAAVEGTLTVDLYRRGRHRILRAERALRIDGRQTLALPIAALLGEFHDLSHAYRFGPLGCDLVIASLRSGNGHAVLQDVFLPDGRRFLEPDDSCLIHARASALPNGEYALALNSSCFARSVHVEAEGYACDAQYFWLEPGVDKLLRLRPQATRSRPLAGFVHSLNAAGPCRIETVA